MTLATDNASQLKQAGLKITPGRLAVLEQLHQADKPIDVQELIELLNKAQVAIDQATVYRTLDQLVAKQLILQVDFHDGKFRYEIEHEHHHHLVCTVCGSVAPIYEDCVAVSEQTIKSKYNFTVDRHHLEFFGRCQKCN